MISVKKLLVVGAATGVSLAGIAGCSTKSSALPVSSSASTNNTSNASAGQTSNQGTGGNAVSTASNGTGNSAPQSTTSSGGSANSVSTGSSSSSSVSSTEVSSGSASSSASGNTTTAASQPPSSTTSASSGSSGASASQSSNQSPFPLIIRMPMNHLPNNIRAWAYAPTLYPVPASNNHALFYSTMVMNGSAMNFTGQGKGYYVTLKDKQGRAITDFSGTEFHSAADANKAIATGFGSAMTDKGTQKGTTLSTGIHAKIATDTKNNASHITWSEGRWKIDVTNVGSTQPAQKEANTTVNYLHSHFLPVPKTTGQILVRVSHGRASVQMTWQEGTTVLKMDTTPFVTQPIQTAFAMAISMKKYS